MSLLACCLYISTTVVTATAITAITATTATATVAATPSGNSAKAAVAAAASAVPGANRKRVALRSVDPLTRRSAVDKHFIRFGRNELDGDGGASAGTGDGDSGRYSPRKSINLRKREIFQDTAVRPRHIFGAENWLPGHGDTDVQVVGESTRSLSLADCWSSSAAAKSGNRTCLDRLRTRQQQHHQQHHRRQQKQRNRPPYYNYNAAAAAADNANLDQSDNHVGNDDNAYLDADTTDTRGDQFVANNVGDESPSVQGDNDDDDDHDDDDDDHDDQKYAIDILRDYQRSRTNNASNDGDAFFTVNLAPAAAPVSATSKFRADWRNILDGEQFVRTSRNKFSRNLFSRYDRGRDNFMRLGRSKMDGNGDDDGGDDDVTKEKTLPAPSVDDSDDQDRDESKNKDDDDDDDDYASWSRSKRNPVVRFARKHDSFMRLGRKHDSNFMRLGRTQVRSSSPFIRYGRNGHSGVGGDYDRWTRKHDNFMRLGRNQVQRQHPRPQGKREKAQNFMRLGRRDGDFKPRQLRKSAENFMRFGRRLVQSGGNFRESRQPPPSPSLLTLSRLRRQTRTLWQPDAQFSDDSSITTEVSVRRRQPQRPPSPQWKMDHRHSSSSGSGSGSDSYSSIAAFSI